MCVPFTLTSTEWGLSHIMSCGASDSWFLVIIVVNEVSDLSFTLLHFRHEIELITACSYLILQPLTFILQRNTLFTEQKFILTFYTQACRYSLWQITHQNQSQIEFDLYTPRIFQQSGSDQQGLTLIEIIRYMFLWDARTGIPGAMNAR